MSLQGGADPRYSNPELPEGINASEEHPLREFAWLGTGAVALVLVIVFALGWAGQWMGALIPFSFETRLAASVASPLREAPDSPAREALQKLADRLVKAHPLPEGMRITLHLADSPERNAFATLGGHVFVTRGLLAALPSENALAMVLAHEIGHVRQRHVIRSIGRGLLVSLALGVLTGSGQDDPASGALSQAGLTSALGFSRDQEREADQLGLHALQALYGHVAGAASLFELLEKEHGLRAPEWFNSHPDNAARIAAIEMHARTAGWPLQGSLSPMPSALVAAAAQ